MAQQAKEQLSTALKMFKCAKDADIETFLHTKAIEFEKRGYCTVYLILDEEAFENGKLSIQAYFTLSHKSIEINPEVSRTVRSKIASRREAELVHFVLIGQLGKYIEKDDVGEYHSTEISATDILNDAFDIIQKASDIIVCRGVLVECSSEEKIHTVYKNYGFSYLQYDEPHYQFYKRVTNGI
ncbi:MAG: hypothetical protein NC433_11260 [Clostridiales bacterium]|nr:hypothetical protein [Clostridiales bacterium]